MFWLSCYYELYPSFHASTSPYSTCFNPLSAYISCFCIGFLMSPSYSHTHTHTRALSYVRAPAHNSPRHHHPPTRPTIKSNSIQQWLLCGTNTQRKKKNKKKANQQTPRPFLAPGSKWLPRGSFPLQLHFTVGSWGHTKSKLFFPTTHIHSGSYRLSFDWYAADFVF